MILRRLRVNPFGRFTDGEVLFAPGLTVVLGPNESGKSTLFNAIGSVLFVPARLSKPKFREKIGRFVPVGGGDVVRAELDFEAIGGEYRLSRRWGTEPASELRQPGAGPLADEEAIRARVAELLPASPATVVAVLLLRQSELAATVSSLGEADSVAEDLGAVIPRAMLQAGGVSTERFRSLLAREAKVLFSHWDAGRGTPEANRGLRNPWRREVGEILAAFYELESVRGFLERATGFERGLDELNRRIESATGALAERGRLLAERERAYRDARERGRLEAVLQAARTDQVQLKRDAADWAVCEERLKMLSGDIARAEAGREPLVRERAAAEAEEQARSVRERAIRVERRARALVAAEAAFAAVPRLDRAALADIQALSREVERLAGAPAAGATVRLSANRAMSVRFERGGAGRDTLAISPGEERSLEVGAGIAIEHAGLTVSVDPAGDADALGRSLAAARKRLAEALAAAGCASADEADVRTRQSERLADEASQARRELDGELAGESLDDFRARVKALGPPRERRPAAEVAGDLARLEVSLEALGKERQERRGRLDELVRRHGTGDALMEALAERARQEREASRQLEGCAPLPEGFADAAAFVQAYERWRDERDRLKDEQNGLLRERAALEATAPEQASGELAPQLEDARLRFDAAVGRGRALERVRAATDRLLDTGGAGSWDGLRAGIERLLETMSLGRWGRVAMEGPLPAAVGASEGAELPWGYLSAGAKDLLGLAVRLAMAGFFIGDAGGFLVMDDPLVDLDPGRQRAAAAALRDFAARRQLVVFTCHPAHAELLGGEQVRLG